MNKNINRRTFLKMTGAGVTALSVPIGINTIITSKTVAPIHYVRVKQEYIDFWNIVEDIVSGTLAYSKTLAIYDSPTYLGMVISNPYEAHFEFKNTLFLIQKQKIKDHRIKKANMGQWFPKIELMERILKNKLDAPMVIFKTDIDMIQTCYMIRRKPLTS